MPFLNLAATPAVRFPDPLEKRVSPNGTQSLSAYNAACLYYDPSAGKWFADIAPTQFGLRPIEFLLFGTDYPALVTATSSYGENVDGNGSYYPTFNESDPIVGSYGVSTLDLLMPTAEPVDYKQIATGLTATSNLRVQGFPQITYTKWHGVVRDDPPTQDASFLLSLSVLMNSPVVNSSTAFVDRQASRRRIPVIAHEASLTQSIMDNGYTILNQTIDLSALFGTLYPLIQDADLDVVGLWATDYDPLNP
jgi:hypothetical protein